VDEAAEFGRLVDGLRARDPAAADELYRRYGPFIRTAVRRRLHPRLRSRFDSLDFVQDVWASFLTLPLDRYEFPTPAALLGFLQQVASNKVVETFRRRFRSDRDDVNREVPLDGRPVPITAPGPTPSQFAIAREELDHLLDQLPPGHRQIVLRLREGYQLEDIARLAGVSKSTVNRVVRRLKELSGV
jgi:RNA polymerase sigma-70 factor (ECF subfamily)